MPIYAQIQNNKVVTVASSENTMVEIDTLDTRLLGCTYDPDTGTFSGYKITLTTDKSYIMSDGTDTMRITATIKTWDDQVADDIYSDPIMFVVDGVPKLISKKEDGYYIDYSTSEAGTKQINTQDDHFIAQGSVSVMAVEVERYS